MSSSVGFTNYYDLQIRTRGSCRISTSKLRTQSMFEMMRYRIVQGLRHLLLSIFLPKRNFGLVLALGAYKEVYVADTLSVMEAARCMRV